MLYEKEADGLYSFVKKFGISKEMAEDIVQETFCAAIKRAEDLRNHPNPVGWLYVTVRYIMVSENRKSKKSEAFYSLSELENQLYDTEAESFLASVEDDRIRSALSKEEYKILELIYKQGYKGKEAAKKLGMNENTLRVQTLRIRRKLQVLVEKK